MDPRQIGYMGWPASLAHDTTDSVTFYYTRYGTNVADSLPWTVRQDTYGKWRIFYAPYHVNRLGDTLRFSKAYQPTSVTLTTSLLPRVQKTLGCHWEYNLNPLSGTGDSGIIYLDDTISPSDIHSYTERYAYSVDEGDFACPAVPFDLYSDTIGDYKYHTFAVEVLPHELRYLIDSNVVLRLPDRLIPPGNKEFGLNLDRGPADLRIGEFDLEGSDPFGLDTTFVYWLPDTITKHYNSVTYAEKKYFEDHPHNPGFRDVTINGKTYHAAHNLIDYVKIWDVPKDVKIPDFPH
jgi:hypothetical protein